MATLACIEPQCLNKQTLVVCTHCDPVWFPRACGWWLSKNKGVCPDCVSARKYDLREHCPRGKLTSDHLCICHALEFETYGACNAGYEKGKSKNTHDKGGGAFFPTPAFCSYNKGYDKSKGKNGYDEGKGKNGYDKGYGYGKDNRDHGDRYHGRNGWAMAWPPPPPPPPTTTGPPGLVAENTWEEMWGTGDGDTGDGDDNGKGDDDDSNDDAPPLARRCDAQTSTSGEILKRHGVKVVLRQIEPQIEPQD